MVLQELGGQITNALRRMSDATLVDKTVIDSCMKEICNALITADVNVKLVSELRKVKPCPVVAVSWFRCPPVCEGCSSVCDIRHARSCKVPHEEIRVSDR